MKLARVVLFVTLAALFAAWYMHEPAACIDPHQPKIFVLTFTKSGHTMGMHSMSSTTQEDHDAIKSPLRFPRVSLSFDTRGRLHFHRPRFIVESPQ